MASTERVTILMPPDKKAALSALAAERGLSLGEFFRQAGDRLAAEKTDEEEALIALTAEVNAAIPRMLTALDEMHNTIGALRAENDAFFREKGVDL